MKTRVQRSVAAVAAVSVAVLLSLVAFSAPASAWPTSSRVDLGGKANCISPTDRVTKVELWVKRKDTGSEVYINAGLDSGAYQRKYSARLSVPGAGVSIWARVSCRSTAPYWTGGPGKFEVKRPAVGYSVTRNLCRSSPCL